MVTLFYSYQKYFIDSPRNNILYIKKNKIILDVSKNVLSSCRFISSQSYKENIQITMSPKRMRILKNILRVEN